MDYVEVRGKSVDVAVEVAMKELGVAERDRVDVEVVQEPEKAMLGLFGGRDAIVRVALKSEPAKKRRRRRRKKGGEDQRSDSRDQGSDGRRSDARQGARNGGSREQRGGRDGAGAPDRGRQSRQQGGRGSDQSSRGQRTPRNQGERSAERSRPNGEEREVSIDEQVPVVEEFLSGLVSAFGLDGGVDVATDGDVIVANVTGSQTEAMVGPRGSVIESIHELTKTVLHRRTQSSSRVRLDVAGYAERRRQALAIYANQLLDQVAEEGGEVMLEPMSAADRKVIHDAVAARSGVRSYSEGEAPQRYVVISSVDEAGSPDAGSSESGSMEGGSEEEE